MNNAANLFIVAAPSGAGKTSLVNALVESMSAMKISVSYTTRPPRPNDVSGEDYHFVSESEFRELVEQNTFLEHAEVFGHHYGTSREWVTRQLERGIDVILEIDWQGSRQICELFPPAVSIFVLPPSLTELENRLRKRAQDNDEVVAQRMAAAQSEMQHYSEFKYLIINDDFDTALESLRAIVHAERLRMPLQQQKHGELLAELLATR